MAVPLRGGGKGLTTKPGKGIFLLKISYFRQLIDVWTYHVKAYWQIFLLVCYNIFQKIGLFQSINWGEKKILRKFKKKFKTKKTKTKQSIPPLSSRAGGGRPFSGTATKFIFPFYAAFLTCSAFFTRYLGIILGRIIDI